MNTDCRRRAKLHPTSLSTSVWLFAGLLMICPPLNGATPGTYEIATQTSEPNMRENLRYSDHTVRRMLPSDVTKAYFPVLDLPLFSACALTSPKVLNASVMYFLACPGSSGTTGSAIVQDHGQRIEGVLSVRMGGKNMTFTQRIDAHLSDTSD